MKKGILLTLLSAVVGGLTAYGVVSLMNDKEVVVVSEGANGAQFRTVNLSHDKYPDFTYAAESCVDAVVYVKVSSTQTYSQDQNSIMEFFFGIPQQGAPRSREKVGSGSGVIISKDGYIVTNNHVIEGADIISVKLNDGREFKGRIVGTDPSTDLALVKIEGEDLPTIPVGDSDQLKIGEWVLAVGNPFNMTSTVTAGIVSAKARSLGVYNNGVESFIQTDAAINQGNSGGALVNARGELVGINSVLYSPTGSYSGYGFAIPTSIMTKVIADLKQYGTVQRARLGIEGTALDNDGQMMTPELKKKAEELGATEGVWVGNVLDNSSASGILEVDDVIIGIEGNRIQMRQH